VNRLRERFGPDDLDITTSEEGATGARVGNYLTDNIYTDVTVSSDGSSEINLNLTLSPSLMRPRCERGGIGRKQGCGA
jgi:translocation and assembly module TamB